MTIGDLKNLISNMPQDMIVGIETRESRQYESDALIITEVTTLEISKNKIILK